MRIKATKPGNSSWRVSKFRVFSIMKQANVSKFVANVLELATDGEGGSGRKKTL